MKTRNVILSSAVITLIVALFIFLPTILKTAKTIQKKAVAHTKPIVKQSADSCIQEITAQAEQFQAIQARLDIYRVQDKHNENHTGMAELEVLQESVDLIKDIKTSLKTLDTFPLNSIKYSSLMNEYHKLALESARDIASGKGYILLPKSDPTGGPYQGATGGSLTKALPPIPGTGGPGKRGKIFAAFHRR